LHHIVKQWKEVKPRQILTGRKKETILYADHQILIADTENSFGHTQETETPINKSITQRFTQFKETGSSEKQISTRTPRTSKAKVKHISHV
jgi:hypothetical protein